MSSEPQALQCSPSSLPELSVLIDTSNQDQFADLMKSHKISTDEYKVILEILGRKPTMAELGVFSAMWSEHCSYKSSKVHLKTLPTTGPNVVVGPGENAGVVRLSGKLCVAFKMESHNHPSYIEPYQGAATGVGGILRDVFCMGARPIANLNSLRFGHRTHPRTDYLLDRVVKGIGDYGNCVGIPTVAGQVAFHPSYNGNCLVNAMTVGLIHEDQIFKGYASGVGNLVVYVGSATGRDGIHGATMASDSFSSTDEGSRTTVQVGDPFAEKLLLEATLDMLEKGLVLGLQDMGAAGLTSSSFEMADRAGSGLLLDLDKVPVRAKKMTAYELLLSESQERMLLCVEPHKWDELKDALCKWELPFAVIGEVTDTGRVQIVYKGELEADVPVGPLASKAPEYNRPIEPTPAITPSDDAMFEVERLIEQTGIERLLTQALMHSGDKKPVYDQYDHHIGVKTVRGPEDGGAAVLRISSNDADPADDRLGLSVAVSCNERYCGVNPKLGAAHAVLKSARAIAAMGGEPLAVTDCLNYGNPEIPAVMAQISEGIEGIGDACLALSTPVVSGNVSLYNQTGSDSILPTPMIGMVGRHKVVDHAPRAVFSANAGPIALLRPKTGGKWSYGGSLAAYLLEIEKGLLDIPSIDWAIEKEAISFLQQLVADYPLAACRDVGEGGLLTTLVKMCLAEACGFEGKLAFESNIPPVRQYLAEAGPMYIIQFASESDFKAAVESTSGLTHLEIIRAGEANRESKCLVDGLELDLAKLKTIYENALLV
jgi:phosphoribosylformylglycinamidine synthase II